MTTKDNGIRSVNSIFGSRPLGQNYITVKFREEKRTADDRKKRDEDENGEKFEKEEHKVDVTA
jgi:hypothetical protein